MRSTLLLVVLFLTTPQVNAQSYVFDHFDGSVLSDIWTQTQGDSRDYYIANSKLHITGTSSGVWDGVWRHLRFETPFEADGDFVFSTSFYWPRDDYKGFDVVLRSESGERVGFFRLWDTPSNWVLLFTPECPDGGYHNPPYDPTDIRITRTRDTISFFWHDTLRSKCLSQDTVAKIELIFSEAVYDWDGFQTVTIDSIYAVAQQSQEEAEVLHVPAEYVTIQSAIAAASNGDTVLVAPGEYREILDYLGKRVVVRSEFGPDSTLLTYPNRVDELVRFHNGEDTTSVLEGFRISDVSHNLALISIQNSGARVSACHFAGNTNFKPSPSSYGVIGIDYGDFVVIENCHFESNQSYSYAAIGCSGGRGRISGCAFVDNTAFGDYGGAVGIGGWNERSSFEITHNLFVGNSAPHGGAVFVSENDSTYIGHNTFYDNTSSANDGGGICVWYYCQQVSIVGNVVDNCTGYGIANRHGSTVEAECNNVFSCTPSNYSTGVSPGSSSISANPLFCNLDLLDFTVSIESPCLPSNNDCGALIGSQGNGCDTPTGIDDSEDPAVPVSGELVAANFPNPFNPATQIKFSVPRAGQTQVDVFNIRGQRLTRLLDSYLSAGQYTVQWDATGRSSGVYIYRVHLGAQQISRKMLLLK